MATRRGWCRLVGLLLTLALGGVGVGAADAQPPAGLVGHWTFNAGSGTTAVDAVTPGHPLTLEGGAGRGAGVIGPHALALDGDAQYARSSGPVLNTTGSYTVSAWVQLTSTDGFQTFVSQDGTSVSGFFLQLRNGRFAFSVPAADSPTAPVTVVSDAEVIPQPGEWYELSGVVDAAAHSVSLYVNGTLAQTKPAPTAWAATGAFAVGRSLYAATDRDFVHGEIDDVRAYAAALATAQLAPLAGPGQLTLNLRAPGAAVRPTQFGEFLEEINHSGDGGVYAELIRNRDLKQNRHLPADWSATGATPPSIALSDADPLTKANPVSLAMSVPAGAAPGTSAVANAGWWGFPVRPSTTYRVSLFVRGDGPARRAPLTVSLQSDSGQVWAAAPAGTPTRTWRHVTLTLTTPATVPVSLQNRFVISTSAARAGGGTDWFALPSVFPPTYDGLANGFRIDLMRRLAALRPGYLRIPGGNYLEGETTATRLNWQQTIGPIEDRPGHDDSAWGYWSQDGMGLLEYLELAQELHARPILDVYAGYSLNGGVVGPARLVPYVTSAVNELQYATGSTSTYWGHQRARDGHPAPFGVHMVEIGNEDFFDSSGSYGSYRYPMFYDAIHGAFPQIRLIASEPVTSRPVFAVDHHYYARDPTTFEQDAHLFDNFAPKGAKVLVGEYGAVQGSPTGDVADALGEAAFLSGTIRDAGIVLGASYAPLLVNVNRPDWPTNLVGFDALSSYGSPSYYVQKMFAGNLGRRVVATDVVAGTGTLFTVATESPGHVDLDVVNDGPTAAAMQVALNGLGTGATGATATVLSGAPGAVNTLTAPDQVVPQTQALGPLAAQFAYTFAADSVTVLNLLTG